MIIRFYFIFKDNGLVLGNLYLLQETKTKTKIVLEDLSSKSCFSNLSWFHQLYFPLIIMLKYFVAIFKFFDLLLYTALGVLLLTLSFIKVIKR